MSLKCTQYHLFFFGNSNHRGHPVELKKNSENSETKVGTYGAQHRSSPSPNITELLFSVSLAGTICGNFTSQLSGPGQKIFAPQLPVT
jgi:hypothetical protein